MLNCEPFINKCGEFESSSIVYGKPRILLKSISTTKFICNELRLVLIPRSAMLNYLVANGDRSTVLGLSLECH